MNAIFVGRDRIVMGVVATMVDQGALALKFVTSFGPLGLAAEKVRKRTLNVRGLPLIAEVEASGTFSVVGIKEMPGMTTKKFVPLFESWKVEIFPQGAVLNEPLPSQGELTLPNDPIFPKEEECSMSLATGAMDVILRKGDLSIPEGAFHLLLGMVASRTNNVSLQKELHRRSGLPDHRDWSRLMRGAEAALRGAYQIGVAIDVKPWDRSSIDPSQTGFTVTVSDSSHGSFEQRFPFERQVVLYAMEDEFLRAMEEFHEEFGVNFSPAVRSENWGRRQVELLRLRLEDLQQEEALRGAHRFELIPEQKVLWQSNDRRHCNLISQPSLEKIWQDGWFGNSAVMTDRFFLVGYDRKNVPVSLVELCARQEMGIGWGCRVGTATEARELAAAVCD